MRLQTLWVGLVLVAGGMAWAAQSKPPAKPPPPPASKPAPIPEPPATQQAKAEKLVRELFRQEYARIGAADREALGRLLLSKSAEATDDPVARFVMLRESCRLASETGDARTVMAALGSLAEIYQCSPRESREFAMSAMLKLEDTVRQPEQARVVAEAYLSRADESVEADQYDAALRELGKAERLARILKDTGLLGNVQAQLARAQELSREAMPLRAGLAKLATDPADAEANSAVGLFYCLIKERWKVGLPMLARGSDKDLMAIAALELGPPTGAEQQIRTGDLWWQWGQGQPLRVRGRAWSRAMGWYESALPQLSGMAKIRIEQRLKEISTSIGLHQGGVVEGGNVALASRGAKLTGPTGNPAALLDGAVKGYNASHGFTSSGWPAQWTVTLPKVYLLREIRLLLWDGDSRFYQYTIETSRDGTHFSPLADRSTGKWQGWQRIKFPAKPVKAIRIHCLHNSANRAFHAVELEAYCTPPD